MKNILKVIAYSFLISLFISPFRSGFIQIGSVSGFKLSSLLSLFILYPFTLFLLNKHILSSFKTTLSLLLGISIVRLPLHLLYFSSTQGSLLEYILQVLSIVFASICFNLRKGAFFFSFLFLLSGIFLSTKGYDYWIHKINFGTFTGKLNKTLPSGYTPTFQTYLGEDIDLTAFEDKFLVLDCWYTSCGACYQKMPQLELLFQQYSTNKEVAIFSLHCRIEKEKGLRETYDHGYKILKERGYSVPCLSIDIEHPSLKEWEVNLFPTVLIFDKKQNLIFWGNIEQAYFYINEVVK